MIKRLLKEFLFNSGKWCFRYLAKQISTVQIIGVLLYCINKKLYNLLYFHDLNTESIIKNHEETHKTFFLINNFVFLFQVFDF